MYHTISAGRTAAVETWLQLRIVYYSIAATEIITYLYRDGSAF